MGPPHQTADPFSLDIGTWSAVRHPELVEEDTVSFRRVEQQLLVVDYLDVRPQRLIETKVAQFVRPRLKKPKRRERMAHPRLQAVTREDIFRAAE